MFRFVPWVALAATAAALALTWMGSEVHYRNCVTAADLRYPAPSEIKAPTIIGGTVVTPGTSMPPARIAAINGCSRLP